MSAQVVQQPALPLRSHTILGVCEGLGEDFGISPLWFRVPLSAAVLVTPLGAIGAYFALGAIVFGSRLLFPDRNAEKAPAQVTDQAQDVSEEREYAEAA